MAQTTMSTNLLQALQVITKFRVDTVGQDLRVFAIHNVLLPVQEPRWDLELCRVLHDRYYPLKLIRVEVTSTFLQVHIGLFADDVGISSPDTLDLGQGVHDFALSVNIGVQKTENVLELRVGVGGD